MASSAPERDERLMRAIAAADRASTSMTPYGPMNDRWMRGFLDTLAAEGLAIVDAALLAVGERDKAEIARLTEAANEVLADAELMAEGTLYHCATDPMYRLMQAVLAGEEDARG